MKKSKPKDRKWQTARRDQAPAAPTPRTRADLSSVRQQVSDVVVREAMGMVTATIDQVKEGHFQAMKYLFEMVGLFPPTATQESAQDSLAGTLLGRLGLMEESEQDQEGLASRTATPSTVE